MKINLCEYRRFYVAQQIQKYNITSIADFGCGEGKLITYLIENFKFDTNVKLNNIIAVDIDEKKCMRCSDEIKKLVKDNRQEYLKLTEFSKRKSQFYSQSQHLNYPNVLIYNDDILQKNKELQEFFVKNKIDLITSLEIIEHLHKEQIDKYFDSLLGFYNTKYVLITTPNIEYNIHYKLKKNRLRHHDHKFEFTRDEFNILCREKAIKYNYDVILDGIGHLDLNLGYPTQLGLFIKKFDINVSKIWNTSINPNIIYEISINENVKEKEMKKTSRKKLICFITKLIYNNSKELTMNEIFNYHIVRRVFKKLENFKNFLRLPKVKKIFRHNRIFYNADKENEIDYSKLFYFKI